MEALPKNRIFLGFKYKMVRIWPEIYYVGIDRAFVILSLKVFIKFIEKVYKRDAAYSQVDLKTWPLQNSVSTPWSDKHLNQIFRS